MSDNLGYEKLGYNNVMKIISKSGKQNKNSITKSNNGKTTTNAIRKDNKLSGNIRTLLTSKNATP